MLGVLRAVRGVRIGGAPAQHAKGRHRCVRCARHRIPIDHQTGHKLTTNIHFYILCSRAAQNASAQHLGARHHSMC